MHVCVYVCVRISDSGVFARRDKHAIFAEAQYGLRVIYMRTNAIEYSYVRK